MKNSLRDIGIEPVINNSERRRLRIKIPHWAPTGYAIGKTLYNHKDGIQDKVEQFKGRPSDQIRRKETKKSVNDKKLVNSIIEECPLNKAFDKEN